MDGHRVIPALVAIAGATTLIPIRRRLIKATATG
jgi:hypothetical protein